MTNVWMPLYVGDYLADTTHLSAAEHGAYLLLIFSYWQAGSALPDDDAKLARIARMSPKEWRAARQTIVEFFDVHDGFWRHARIDVELAKAERITDQKRNAGRASAERRAQRQGNGRSTDVGEPLQRQGQRRGNQSPSPSPVGLEPSSSTEARPPACAHVREAGAQAAGPDEAGQVVQAFDAAGKRYFPETWRPWPGPKDHGTARAMLEAGADLALCAAAFDALLATMAAKGQPPPRGLSYARGAVADAVASAREGLPSPRLARAAEPTTAEVLALAERKLRDVPADA